MQHAPIALQLLLVAQLSQTILILDPLGCRFGLLFHGCGEGSDVFQRTEGTQLEAGDTCRVGSRRTEQCLVDEDECRREHLLSR